MLSIVSRECIPLHIPYMYPKNTELIHNTYCMQTATRGHSQHSTDPLQTCDITVSFQALSWKNVL